MDIEQARANMIARQIRPWNVLDAQTLSALAAVRRETFVPAQHQSLAFADAQISLGCDEVMLEPKLGARMIQALALQPGDAALEVGAGGGWLTAMLATLGAKVISVEIHAQLLSGAERNLAAHQDIMQHITLQQGDAHAGWGDAEQFDAILITGSLPTIVAADELTAHNVNAGWAAHLAEGGRLVGIEGDAPAMRMVCITKRAGKLHHQSLLETVVPRLRNVDEPRAFQF